MTVKGLSKFIREKAPEAISLIALNSLAGKAVSIDATGWVHTNSSVASKKVIKKTNILDAEPNLAEMVKFLTKQLIVFIKIWLRYKITPIFVFDGVAPREKDAVRQKRRSEKEAKRTEIAQIKASEEVTQDAIVRLSKLYSNLNLVDGDVIDSVIAVLVRLGIPYILAKGEADPACASLVIEGKAAAVFSSDLDHLAHGASYVITKLEGTINVEGKKVHQAKCYRLSTVLTHIQMDYRRFVDFCIMCGCDYNKNVYNVGPGKAYTHLQNAGCIEKVDLVGKEILNHLKCRELFTYVKSEDQTVEGRLRVDLKEYVTNVIEIMDIFQLHEHLTSLSELIQSFS